MAAKVLRILADRVEAISWREEAVQEVAEAIMGPWMDGAAAGADLFLIRRFPLLLLQTPALFHAFLPPLPTQR